MTEPQVPRMADIVTPAIDALVSGLPQERAAQRSHMANHGRYGDIIRGWRGQAELARARMTREIIATRLLEQNGGQPLRDLAKSEYFARLAEEPRHAVGEMYAVRSKRTNSSWGVGVMQAGVIPAGTRINRPATNNQIPTTDADYVVSADVVCSANATSSASNGDDGTWTHSQVVVVPIRAASPGAGPNTLTWGVQPQGKFASRLFDSSAPPEEQFQGGDIFAAGGFVDIPDAQIRDFARSMGGGFSGGNNAAALAGARANPGVRRVAAALDYGTAVLRIYVADQSWATSQRYRDDVRQAMFDNVFVPFGGRVAIGGVYNVPVVVKATVFLRNRTVDAERSAVVAAIMSKLTGYFDDRPDFYYWNLDAIGGVVAAAEPRVQTCANPQVLSGGVAIAEPAKTIASGAGSVPHFSLRGVDLTFQSLGS